MLPIRQLMHTMHKKIADLQIIMLRLSYYQLDNTTLHMTSLYSFSGTHCHAKPCSTPGCCVCLIEIHIFTSIVTNYMLKYSNKIIQRLSQRLDYPLPQNLLYAQVQLICRLSHLREPTTNNQPSGPSKSTSMTSLHNLLGSEKHAVVLPLFASESQFQGAVVLSSQDTR